MLHIRSDFLYVDLGVGLLLPIHILFQEGHVPPLNIRDRLAPHYLGLDLANAHLGLLLLLLLLFILFLLLFPLVFLLLSVHAQRFLLHFLDEPLLFLHQRSLLNESEGLPLRPLRSRHRLQGCVEVRGLTRPVLLEAQDLFQARLLFAIDVDLEGAHHLRFHWHHITLLVQLTAELVEDELAGLRPLPRHEASGEALILKLGHLLLNLPLEHSRSLRLLEGVSRGRGRS
mmetsp:Transcript_30766/g.80931  ORF Transcript_30766/g.80931 Transcript_30766/m.80931 type:complete len:229 (+) Transcript_30766:907-1593(+)